MENSQIVILENSSIDLWTLIVGIVSVLVTSFLTVYTIIQNNKLHKKQQDLQLFIQRCQENDNANALKLANRQYAEKVYETAFDIFSLTELLNLQRPFMINKTFEQCCVIFRELFNMYPNIEKEAKYLIIGEEYLTNGLNSTIMELRRAFDDLMQKSIIFRVSEEILTEEEKTIKYKKDIETIFQHVDRIEKTKETLLLMKETQFKVG